MRALLLIAFLLLANCVDAAVTVKIATLAPEGSGWMREMRAAADQVKQQTEGRVEIRYYPGGVMGDDATVLRKIKLGQLQGGALTGSEVSLIHEDAQIYSLPFLFSSYEQIDAVRPKVDPLLKSAVGEKGFHVLSITGVGFAYLMSTQPLQTTEQLQQSKVWVPHNDRIAEATFVTGGVSPIPLPLADVFTSLQTGLIDTVGNTPAGAIALQWHTRVKHLFDLPLTYVVGYVLVDNKAWSKIQSADQAIIESAFTAASQRLDADNRRSDESAMRALEAEGVARFSPGADEIARWRTVGEQVRRDMLSNGDISSELMIALQAAMPAP
jgi:TRAP-type C4-dicarboxylate transport system substrate-binding protein